VSKSAPVAVVVAAANTAIAMLARRIRRMIPSSAIPEWQTPRYSRGIKSLKCRAAGKDNLAHMVHKTFWLIHSNKGRLVRIRFFQICWLIVLRARNRNAYARQSKLKCLKKRASDKSRGHL
jgi:hypothetical protein